jgi:predicted dehydrogenase
MGERMSQRMKLGVVGTGYWAREVHAAGVASHPATELAGVWGRDPAKAAEVADRYSTTAHEDLDDLLEAVDGVVFAVPPDVQAGLAVRAADAGRHLLLEKPLATSLPDAQRVADAVERNRVASVVFFTERFDPEREAWLEGLRDTGCLGAEVSWLASLRDPGNPFAGSPWRQDRGALWDVGPHALSVLLPVLGPVSDIVGARGFDDLVSLVLTHQGGQTSTIRLSLTMPPAATRFDVRYYREDGWQVRPESTPDVAAAHRRALTDLVENAREGNTDHRCDARFARDVVAILERAEQAVGLPR